MWYQHRLTGFTEIQNPTQRYTVIDITALLELTAINNLDQFQKQQQSWINNKMETNLKQNTIWSQSLAVCSANFVERFNNRLR